MLLSHHSIAQLGLLYQFKNYLPSVKGDSGCPVHAILKNVARSEGP